eukprot:716532-Rhodomonas_salina.3
MASGCRLKEPRLRCEVLPRRGGKVRHAPLADADEEFESTSSKLEGESRSRESSWCGAYTAWLQKCQQYRRASDGWGRRAEQLAAEAVVDSHLARRRVRGGAAVAAGRVAPAHARLRAVNPRP